MASSWICFCGSPLLVLQPRPFCFWLACPSLAEAAAEAAVEAVPVPPERIARSDGLVTEVDDLQPLTLALALALALPLPLPLPLTRCSCS